MTDSYEIWPKCSLVIAAAQMFVRHFLFFKYFFFYALSCDEDRQIFNSPTSNRFSRQPIGISPTDWHCAVCLVVRTSRKAGNSVFTITAEIHACSLANCCGASVASEQQHKQDLRRIYKRENEFSKSSLFTRMLCGFLPECIAPSTRVHCATNNTRLWHCSNGVFFLRGLQLRQVSGYGLLWFTCKTMWARSCLAFTTLAVVVNAKFESLEIWTINCDVLI